jgi:hypothetical protein
VKLQFVELESISFRKEGDLRKANADVKYKDGRTDAFLVFPFMMFGDSSFGPWQMHSSGAKKIEFRTSDVSEPTSDYDQVQMKNGDLITGRIVTATFILRTSYGTHSFAAKQIQSINLEGAGQNMDLVTLRIGDKLSGVVENATVRISMRSGAEVELSKDKMKDILFRR